MTSAASRVAKLQAETHALNQEVIGLTAKFNDFEASQADNQDPLPRAEARPRQRAPPNHKDANDNETMVIISTPSVFLHVH